MEQKKRHLFHLVDYSPWPLFVSLGAFFFTMFIVLTIERLEIKKNVEVENYRLPKWILDDFGIVNEVKDGIVVVKEGLNTVGMSEMVVFEKTGMKGIVNFLGKEKSITVLGNIRNIKVGDMVKCLLKVKNILKNKKIFNKTNNINYFKSTKRYYFSNNINLGGGLSKSKGNKITNNNYIQSLEQKKLNGLKAHYAGIKQPTRCYITELNKNQKIKKEEQIMERYDLKNHVNNLKDLEGPVICIPCCKLPLSGINDKKDLFLKTVGDILKEHLSADALSLLVNAEKKKEDDKILSYDESIVLKSFLLLKNNKFVECVHATIEYRGVDGNDLSLIATSSVDIIQNTIMNRDTGLLATYYTKPISQKIVRYNNQNGESYQTIPLNYTVKILTELDKLILKSLGAKNLLQYYKLDKYRGYQNLYNIKKNELRIEEKLIVLSENKNIDLFKKPNEISLLDFKKAYEINNNEVIYPVGLVTKDEFNKIWSYTQLSKSQIEMHIEYTLKLILKLKNLYNNEIDLRGEFRIDNFAMYNRGIEYYFNNLSSDDVFRLNAIIKNNDTEKLKIIIINIFNFIENDKINE